MGDEGSDCEDPFALFVMEEWLRDFPTEVPSQAASTTLQDSELKDFIEQSRATNTVKKMKSDLTTWYRWCESIQETRKIEDIPTEELNRLLSHFFINVRKQNGEDYEPGILTSFQCSLDRHLRNCDQVQSIIEDREFVRSREALTAKRKHLKKGGKGTRKNAAEALSAADEEKLWESGQLGDHSPEALLRTVWFYATMHFGWRGRDEHHRARYGDFRSGVSDDGREYIEFFVERGSKTRTGATASEARRAFHPRMFATGTTRCPVAIFKKFLDKRPLNACNPDSPLYLSAANRQTKKVWYKNQPIGINTLGKFMKSMAEAAGITGKKTNHSARKTMISRLVKENVNPLHVAQLSGHRNLKSLDCYSVASVEQQKAMSMIISGQQPDKASTAVSHSLPTSSMDHCGQSTGNTMFPGMSITL